jgi:hypothetical protein
MVAFQRYLLPSYQGRINPNDEEFSCLNPLCTYIDPDSQVQ